MNKKNNIQLILLLLAAVLGIGYAYINSDLNINGTAKIKNANWDVHWANVQIKSGSVTGENVVTAPTISNSTTVNFSVVLPTPGTYYEFTVDAVNGGSIDAMIDTIDSKLNGVTITTLPAYLEYTVTYGDGLELEPNHELKANTTETYKVKIKYRDDIELNQIPTTDQTLSLEFTVTYRQSDENSEAVPRSTYIYTANLYDYNHLDTTQVHLGQAIPNGITQYTNASDALNALRLEANAEREEEEDYIDLQFYLKHKVIGGIVTESYVEFIITPEEAQENPGMTAGTYALRGLDTYDESTNYCKAEYYDTTNDWCISPYYESNKQILMEAFGSSHCYDDEPDPEFTDDFKDQWCNDQNITVENNSRGMINVIYGSWYCYIDEYGSSGCSGEWA